MPMRGEWPGLPVAEYKAKGVELFGPDPHDWVFTCPACGNRASVSLAKERWPELEGKGWRPWSECVGRYTREAGCDWAAYGLFCGPLKLTDEGKPEVYAFDFAGHPFTAHSKTGLDYPLRKLEPLERDTA